jgi:hypothetical protein
MRFRNQGDELVYCTPDDAALKNMKFIEYAAAINVELLYPMLLRLRPAPGCADEPLLHLRRVGAPGGAGSGVGAGTDGTQGMKLCR